MVGQVHLRSLMKFFFVGRTDSQSLSSIVISHPPYLFFCSRKTGDSGTALLNLLCNTNLSSPPCARTAREAGRDAAENRLPIHPRFSTQPGIKPATRVITPAEENFSESKSSAEKISSPLKAIARKGRGVGIGHCRQFKVAARTRAETATLRPSAPHLAGTRSIRVVWRNPRAARRRSAHPGAS